MWKNQGPRGRRCHRERFPDGSSSRLWLGGRNPPVSPLGKGGTNSPFRSSSVLSLPLFPRESWWGFFPADNHRTQAKTAQVEKFVEALRRSFDSWRRLPIELTRHEVEVRLTRLWAFAGEGSTTRLTAASGASILALALLRQAGPSEARNNGSRAKATLAWLPLDSLLHFT